MPALADTQCSDANCLPAIPTATLARLRPLAARFEALLRDAVGRADVRQRTAGIQAAGQALVAAIVDAKLPAPPPLRPDEEARRLGYRGESHNVTAADGHVLGLFRVTSRRCAAFRSVAVLAPGIFSNAASFTFLGRDSLVYQLADRCHDVWLVSFRGDLFSRGHTRLSDKSPEFWDFYPYHYGAYDLPAQLEVISQWTGSSELRYVGMDQACLALLLMNHEHGERYQGLLAGAYILGPMGYLGRFGADAIAELIVVSNVFSNTDTAAKRGELAFWDAARHAAYFNLCSRIAPDVCYWLWQFTSGRTIEIDKTRFVATTRNTLDSTSVRTSDYLTQLTGRVKYMALFDYGEKENLRRYQSKAPPPVRLDRTTVKCSFFGLGNATDIVAADSLDTFNALAASARWHFEVVPGFNSISPFFPVHADRLYGPLLARYERDLRGAAPSTLH